jgi:murein DD-endopeptidase MepM/ murein hydrolase activator NlpD
VPGDGPVSYAHTHHDYPASDVFAGGCGSSIISPVNGTILEARRDDGWVAAIDNPATRGGKSVAILGDDGVRYYLAHFDSITDGIEPGVRVVIGQSLGLMGMTGRAGACHVHVALSPPCPGKEWAVRRGVIWPWRYLDAWRKGEQLSPLPEIEQWVAAHPTACADAMADPNAPDS